MGAPSGEPGRPGRDPCQAPGAGGPARGGGSNATAVLSDSRANGRGGAGAFVPIFPRFLLTPPYRVQRSRRKGARLPPNTVVVSRPSKYANPFRIPTGLTGAARLVATVESVSKFRGHALRSFTLDEIRADLGGKNLACWCKVGKPGELGEVCHADVLLKLANS